MARQSQRQISPINARAIIANSDQAGTARLYVNLDLGSAGVLAVFDSFFNDRSWALDYLASSYLVSESGLQNTNHVHPSGIINDWPI